MQAPFFLRLDFFSLLFKEVEKTLFAGCFDWEFELMKKNGFAVCKVKNPLMDEFFPSRFKCDFYAEKPADLLSFF